MSTVRRSLLLGAGVLLGFGSGVVVGRIATPDAGIQAARENLALDRAQFNAERAKVSNAVNAWIVQWRAQLLKLHGVIQAIDATMESNENPDRHGPLLMTIQVQLGALNNKWLRRPPGLNLRLQDRLQARLRFWVVETRDRTAFLKAKTRIKNELELTLRELKE